MEVIQISITQDILIKRGGKVFRTKNNTVTIIENSFGIGSNDPLNAHSTVNDLIH